MPSGSSCESDVPRRIQKANHISVKGTVDWIHDRELCKCLHHHEHHDSNDDEANDQRPRSSGRQGAACTDENSGTDGTACVKKRPLETDAHVPKADGSYQWQSSACDDP